MTMIILCANIFLGDYMKCEYLFEVINDVIDEANYAKLKLFLIRR
ncbi:unknown [Clostridium sp. CAG:1193]|nr:unknown [Clostridium sp. CAG:1193]